MKYLTPFLLVAWLALMVYGGACVTAGPPAIIPTPTATMPLRGSVTPVAASMTPKPSETPFPTPTATPTPSPTSTPTPPLPPPPPEKGIDVSNFWLAGPVSNQDAIDDLWRIYTSGFTHLIAGTQFPAITQQQLFAAWVVGMSADIYVELYTDSDLNAEMQSARVASSLAPVGATWIAFETPPPAGITPEDWVQQALDAAVNAGLPDVGIYTAAWWWDYWITDSDRFAGWPLWYAYYDGVPSVDWESQHFGSWLAPVWKQYLGNVPRMIDLYQQTYNAVPVNIPLIAKEPGPINVDLNIRFLP